MSPKNKNGGSASRNASPVSGFGSEGEAQAELNLPLRVQFARGDFAEVDVAAGADTEANQVVIAIDGELRVVEDVEELGPELQPGLFGEFEPPEQGEVHVVVSRTREGVAGRLLRN